MPRRLVAHFAQLPWRQVALEVEKAWQAFNCSGSSHSSCLACSRAVLWCTHFAGRRQVLAQQLDTVSNNCIMLSSLSSSGPKRCDRAALTSKPGLHEHIEQSSATRARESRSASGILAKAQTNMSADPYFLHLDGCRMSHCPLVRVAWQPKTWQLRRCCDEKKLLIQYLYHVHRLQRPSLGLVIVCALLNDLTYLNMLSLDKHSLQPVVFVLLPWPHFGDGCSNFDKCPTRRAGRSRVQSCLARRSLRWSSACHFLAHKMPECGTCITRQLWALGCQGVSCPCRPEAL